MPPIKEPQDIDFYVESRPLTKEDEKAITDYIKADKEKRAKKMAKKLNTGKKRAA